MEEFSDCIEDLDLLDPPLEGGVYTWFMGDNHRIASRIDRILFSEEWNDRLRNIKHSILQRIASDHCPISLNCGVWEYNKSYFKFEN